MTLTRATLSAWFVFAVMAGTTITFQVYHSLKFGGMPWPLAALFGVVPLVLSVGVLDFVGDWDDAPPGSMVVAWGIILGALALSSTSTGDVVYKAAPPHMRLLFGLLMDAAAILAAQFLLSKIRKARAEHRAAAARAAAGQHEMLLSQDEFDMVQAMRAGARDRRASGHSGASAPGPAAAAGAPATSAAQDRQLPAR